jgi:hypothetical protein
MRSDLQIENGDIAEWVDPLDKWVCVTDRYKIEILPAGRKYDFPRADGKLKKTIHDDPERDLRFFERVRYQFLKEARLKVSLPLQTSIFAKTADQ